MSLRLRLTVLVAAVFLGFWLIASVWMISGLNNKLEVNFDQRLRSTAFMLSNILAHVPKDALSKSLPDIINASGVNTEKALTCQISSLQGSIIASSNSQSFPNQPSLNQGFSYLSSEQAQWRTFTLITAQYKITIADKVAERDVLYHDLLISILIPPALAIFVALILLWFAIGTGIRPIKLLIHALEKRGSHDLEPIQLNQPLKELQPLITSQNALMARLAKGISREKHFTSNAAHELRTPLAGILAQIQLAELTQDTTQQKALGQAKKSAHRLNTILDNLLVLAHVDADTPLNITEPWELDSVITTVVTESNNNNPRLTYNITASQPVYCIPSAMLTIVCRNLLDNAFKYSKANTPVILAANLTATALKITISNHAHINQADLANMATRFWRKGAANGAGLGLSIVASIAEKYQGSVAFTNDEDRFIVSFNLPIKNVNPQ
ncbi:histidine kinase dimerization/phospho-acceptor domain-containing protein [Pseudoalteromonas nigrifaciens]|uniref:histidine kinase dimerization/phospho-acceptor domain-containing protein n=1 Tax=Pseudoalteromonas nigrifaciens TaxID=28109 RepID=UPI003F996DF1